MRRRLRSNASPATGAALYMREHRLATLIQDIAAGAEQALAAFYDTTITQVYSLARRIVREDAVAEEVMIEVYMQVQRLASTYEPGRGNPSAWLLRELLQPLLDMSTP